MPQGQMTEAEAYALAGQQMKAKAEGRPIPPPPVRTTVKQPAKRMTDEEAYALAGKQIESRKQNMKQGMSYGMGNTDKAVFGPPKASESGGDTLNFLKANQNIPMGKALAYGVSLVERSLKSGEPKDKSEYMRLLSGSEEFRKLDPDSQQKVRLGMQQWFQTQSAFNPTKAAEMKKKSEENDDARKYSDMKFF